MKNDRITLRFLAEPTDVNFGGKVHGGSVMKWIDQAGYTCAVNWCSNYCVTVYVGGIRFLQPIFIGNIVEVKARLLHTGRSSMHIAVDIHATDPQSRTITKTTHCVIVFAAVDNTGKTIEVPKWSPKTEEEIRLNQYILKLVDLRKNIAEEMKDFVID